MHMHVASGGVQFRPSAVVSGAKRKELGPTTSLGVTSERLWASLGTTLGPTSSAPCNQNEIKNENHSFSPQLPHTHTQTVATRSSFFVLFY